LVVLGRSENATDVEAQDDEARPARPDPPRVVWGLAAIALAASVALAQGPGAGRRACTPTRLTDTELDRRAALILR
jgi:hypothetical protein